jgi:hypothetical protein
MAIWDYWQFPIFLYLGAEGMHFHGALGTDG